MHLGIWACMDLMKEGVGRAFRGSNEAGIWGWWERVGGMRC